jgi:dihydroorotase
LLDGTIDCIASHHIPQNYDSKVCEFEYAKNGMIGLESLFGVVWPIVENKWSIHDLIHLLTIAPRTVFDIPIPSIKEGTTACLTLFNPQISYTFEGEGYKIRSKNSAFIGKQLKGESW